MAISSWEGWLYSRSRLLNSTKVLKTANVNDLLKTYFIKTTDFASPKLLQVRKEARRILKDEHSVPEVLLNLGMPEVPLLFKPSLLSLDPIWGRLHQLEALNTPEWVQVEMECMRLTDPKHHFWALGLRDYIMMDSLLDLSQRCNDSMIHVILVILGKSHASNLLRLWKLHVKEDQISVLSRRPPFRRII